MFVHYTLINVLPENVQQAAEVLAGSKTLEYFIKATGLHHGSLSESLEEKGKLLSLSMWDSPVDAQVVFADPNYGALLGELRGLLIAPPARIGHNMLHTHVIRPLDLQESYFIHSTIITVAPENTSSLMAILYSEKTVALTDTIPGFRMSLAFESLEEPGRIVSMSWWNSAADAQSTFTRPEYAALLGDMRAYFIKPPERQGYNLLRIVKHEMM
ncbi:MAG: antibiotic biosynthesis monooxygenase [Anaerolineales bacterium]|nr:antibiotic biosynthesis monooxygenase [Anaerolineales bacterium]